MSGPVSVIGGQATATTTGGPGDAGALDRETRAALADLVLSMADDEFVGGFADSEWTGIAPILEEDVAISSIAQDELGHARALYELLARILDDGRDADAIAFDRQPEEYRHAALLDHPRGDWADTIARRFLYELADEARLASIGNGYPPLADLVGKLRREERYHRMHLVAWAERLGRAGEDARARFAAALDRLGADASSVFTPLGGERLLLAARILARPLAEAEAAWRADLTAILVPLGFDLPPDGRRELATEAGERFGPARLDHSDAFRWLWGEFTSVRRSDPGATW
jgi:ring-1,2-phenylacetyl-CoA epoxidase subunit PaaC